MAVPNTTTFSFEDVRAELGLSGTSSLATAFAAADSTKFDPAYEGSKNSLLNFRNYGNTFGGGGGNSLGISPTSNTLDGSGGSFTITVTSNVSWTATDNASWISLIPTSGSNNGSISVTVSANSGSSRTGTITVSGGGITRTCTVTQTSGIA